MKTIVDYLKQHKQFTGEVGGYKLKLELICKDIIMEIQGVMWCKVDAYRIDICEVLQFLFENFTEMEIRFCEECGKPYDRGFTAENGDWYCCEECFESTMDRDYGRGNWRAAKEEGAYGGWYETLRDGRWEDTGIYWTDWN